MTTYMRDVLINGAKIFDAGFFSRLFSNAGYDQSKD